MFINTRFLKRISISALTALFLVVIFSPKISLAQSQASFSSSGMFLVGNHAQAGTQNWTSSLSNMRPGDQVAFKFTFLNISSVTATAAQSSFTATTNGNTITVTGSIWAQNAPQVSNSVTISAAPGYTIALNQMSASFGGVGDVLSGSSNVEYYATGLYTITGQSQQQPISCSASSDKTSGVAPLDVNFSGSASGGDGSGYKYKWDFGDSSIDYSGPNPNESHTYSKSGSYAATFYAYNNSDTNDLNPCTKTIQISVSTPQQQLNCSVSADPSSGASPLSTTITASTSGGVSPYNYTFSIGDGQPVNTTSNSIQHTYTTNLPSMNFALILEVRDSASHFCSAQGNVLVTNNTPQGSAPIVQTLSATGIGQNSATLNGSVNPEGASTSYWFEYGTTQSLGSTNGSQSIGSGTSAQNVLAIISNLSANTTYYFRIDAQNQYGTAQGSILNFTTLGGGGGGGGSAPSVQTISSGNINQSSATLNGSVNPNGASTNYWFDYGTTQSLGSTTGMQSAGSGSGSLNVSATISNLSANTTYYFRIDAQNQYGTTQGSILSFTTLTGGGGGGCTTAPSVMTLPATNITTNSAQVNGTVNTNGCTNTYYWFEYGTNQSLGNTSAAQVTSGGTVNTFLSNLSSNTIYYFRITSSSGGGTTQGSILNFTTSGGGGGGGNAPFAQTISATQVTTNSATLNGSVNPNGASTNYWFEYSTDQSFGNTTGMQSAGSGSSLLNVLAPVSGLSSNTTYYFRIVAQNQSGTSRGSALSFATTGGGGGGSNIPPTVTTSNASGVTQNSATVSGYVNPNGFSTNYWFEYGTSQSLGNSTGMQSAGSGAASLLFSANLSNLSQNTTYYYRIDAQNQYGTSYGSILNFVTSNGGGGGGSGCSAPYAQTLSATSIYQNSAQLNGSINPNNCSTDYWFEYGTNQNLGNSTGMQSAGSGNGSFNVTSYISGLNYNSTYYFRVDAQNSSGTSYGQILSFSTYYGGGGCQYGNCGCQYYGNCGYGNTPYVTTLSATNVAGSYATFNGSVSSNGSNTYTWFEYGTDMNSLYQSTNSVYIGSGTYNQNFSQMVYNLNSGTTYYFRAAARNDYGISYGQVLSLYGYGGGYGSSAPQVITNAATYVYNTSAMLNGQVDANSETTNAWFEYGTTQNLGSQTTYQAIGTGTNYQNYSFALSALSSNTTYYFRAAAQNGSGTTYGQILSFTTGGGVITVPQQPVVIRTVTTGVATQCVVLVPSLNVSELIPGNQFTLTITYRNGCTSNLSNVFLKVILPPGTDFVSTNYPFFNRDSNGISYNLGAIPTNFQSAVSIEGSVSKAVNAGDSLIFSSVLNFNDEQGRFQSVSAYLTAVVGSGQALGASVFGTIGDLLGNWLFDLLMVLGIAFLVYWIFFKKRETGSPLSISEEDILEAKPIKSV